MKIISKPLSELYTPERNIRRHTDKQIKEYIRSIEMFGQIKPIVIDGNGEIIAGNGLFMALTQMGRETCDCYVIEGLSEKQKKKLMLADNRVYELGITDMDAFDEIIRELGGDVDVPGWDEDLLSMMNAAVDDVDEIVNSYGNFDDHEVSRLAERQPAAGDTTPPPAKTSQEPLPKPSEEGKFVVCPKCGEKICL